jgi:hypothetical protein
LAGFGFGFGLDGDFDGLALDWEVEARRGRLLLSPSGVVVAVTGCVPVTGADAELDGAGLAVAGFFCGAFLLGRVGGPPPAPGLSKRRAASYGDAEA